MIYLSSDNKFYVGPNFDDINTFKNPKRKQYEILFKKDKQNRLFIIGAKDVIPVKYYVEIDAILPIVHGKGLEDGTVSNFFQLLGVCVLESSPTVLSIMQDKYYTKQILKNNNIDTIDYYYFKECDWYYSRKYVLDELSKIPYPIIVKPNSLGSSIGIGYANTKQELLEAIIEVFKYDEACLCEKALKNYREFNCAYLGYQQEGITSAIEEVNTNCKLYTFEDKYINQPEKICPAIIDVELEEKIIDTTIKVCQLLDTSGVVRVDYLYDNENGMLYLNEINGIPGSLSFELFEEKGIMFTELLNTIIDIGFMHFNQLNSKKRNYQSDILDNYQKNKS